MADHPASRTPQTPQTSISPRKGTRKRTILLEDSRRHCRVSGVKSKTTKIQYINVEMGGRSEFIPHSSFQRGGAEAARLLAKAGIVVITSSEWKKICEEVAKIDKFPSRILIEHPGWAVGHFAWSDRVVVSPADREAVALFEPQAATVGTKGSVAAWQQEVAAPLIGQVIPSFLLMATLAGPSLDLFIRNDNIGFEVVGAAGTGKSTALAIAASAVGPAIGGSAETYGMTCRQTVNGAESVMRLHRDMVLILDEAALLAASGSAQARAGAFVELVFMLADGRTKARFDTPTQTRSRFVYLISANESVARGLGSTRPELAAAMADRLMTLTLGEDRPYGIFDFLPPQYRSAGEFADALNRGIAENYGEPMRRFVRYLVKERAADETELRRRIEDHVVRFRARVGCDANNGSERRVADAFGLGYAAGRLAVDAKVLPSGFRCGAAAAACYRLHRASGRPLASFPDRLLALSRHTDAIDLDVTGCVGMTDEEVHRTAAFLHTHRHGERELLLTKQALRRAFPDWLQLHKSPEVLTHLKADKNRQTKKRQLRANSGQEWVYCFRLPE